MTPVFAILNVCLRYCTSDATRGVNFNRRNQRCPFVLENSGHSPGVYGGEQIQNKVIVEPVIEFLCFG